LLGIEKHAGDVERFELFTGHLSERNIRLYEKLGFRKFRQERVNDRLELVFMEKLKMSA
jgi:RimJ/RimL family protein N-acetyltransferase